MNYAGLHVKWLGRPVEVVINCSSSAVDAFIERAFYLDGEEEEVREEDLESIQDAYSDAIQDTAYQEMMEFGNLRYSAD